MFNRLLTWWQNWDENYKRIVLIFLFSGAVVIIGYLLYLFFFKPSAPPPSRLPTEITPGALPPSDIRDILRERGIITEEEVTPTLPGAPVRPDPVARGGRTLATPEVYSNATHADITASGAIAYYNNQDGKFYTLLPDGTLELLSDRQFPNVENATWSPQGAKAVLEFPDGKNIFFDFGSEKQYTLPEEAGGFDFSSTGGQIGYKFITGNSDENWLVVSEPTGDKPRAIEHIGDTNPDDVMVAWSPDNSRVALFRSSATVENEEVFFIGQNQENYKSLPVDGRGFEGIWSPQGNRLLYNVYSAQTGYRPQLWATNATDDSLGVNNKSLALYTWTEKCTWSSDNATVYCAVPLYLTQGTGIYKEIAANVPDTVYKINVQTGFKQQIAIPTNALGVSLYSVRKLMLSGDEKTLHLVTSKDGIYKIQLEE